MRRELEGYGTLGTFDAISEIGNLENRTCLLGGENYGGLFRVCRDC